MTIQNLTRVAEVSNAALRYLPEPASSGVGLFRDVMQAVKSLGTSAVGGVQASIGGDYRELLELQIQAQRELQTTTMVSNIEKAKHESKMAALRNIRVA